MLAEIRLIGDKAELRTHIDDLQAVSIGDVASYGGCAYFSEAFIQTL